MPRFIIAAAAITCLALGACMQKEAPKSASDGGGAAPVQDASGGDMTERNQTIAPTLIGHRPTFERILGNSGLALQWISWEPKDRGKIEATMVDGALWLKGSQQIAGQQGLLELEGRVVSVSDGNFTFNGLIAITDTPDAGRNCRKEGISKFAVTQGRKYFRMREFEWCDGLTDYIDIYF